MKKRIMCILLIISTVLCVEDAYALNDSYVGNFKLQKLLYVNTRGSRYPGIFTIDEGKVEITTRISKQTNEEQATSEYFYVDIYRDKMFRDIKIGCLKMKRKGQTTEVCNNLEKGNYYFVIRKSNDGCYITGSIEIKY